jgi:hypothetical protein
MIKTILIFVVIVLTSCNAIKSTESKSEKTDSMNSFTKDDYNKTIKNWEFITIENSCEVEIIDYYPADMRCGRAIVNALAIVKIKNDTVRIIDQCPGEQNYLIGDLLILNPDLEFPENNNLGITYIDGNPNPIIFKHPKVIKTTFGYLERKR